MAINLLTYPSEHEAESRVVRRRIGEKRRSIRRIRKRLEAERRITIAERIYVMDWDADRFNHDGK